MSLAADRNTIRIRELNDAFRTTFHGGRVMLTAGFNALPEAVRSRALRQLKSFTAFEPGNDPHGEHDFGSFEVAGETFFWKIDCYDERCEFGSEDPSDPKKTTRVLTVMLAEEY